MVTPSIASLLQEIGRPSHFENSGGLSGMVDTVAIESARASVSKQLRTKKSVSEPKAEFVNAKFDPDQALKELGITPGFLNNADRAMLDEMLKGLRTDPQPIEPEVSGACVREAIGNFMTGKRTKNRFRAAPESRLNELAVVSDRLNKTQNAIAKYIMSKQGSHG